MIKATYDKSIDPEILRDICLEQGYKIHPNPFKIFPLVATKNIYSKFANNITLKRDLMTIEMIISVRPLSSFSIFWFLEYSYKHKIILEDERNAINTITERLKTTGCNLVKQRQIDFINPWIIWGIIISLIITIVIIALP